MSRVVSEVQLRHLLRPPRLVRLCLLMSACRRLPEAHRKSSTCNRDDLVVPRRTAWQRMCRTHKTLRPTARLRWNSHSPNRAHLATTTTRTTTAAPTSSRGSLQQRWARVERQRWRMNRGDKSWRRIVHGSVCSGGVCAKRKAVGVSKRRRLQRSKSAPPRRMALACRPCGTRMRRATITSWRTRRWQCFGVRQAPGCRLWWAAGTTMRSCSAVFAKLSNARNFSLVARLLPPLDRLDR
mmetsp:Transcript_121259/g.238290  ORF Transcript_121259/g.238290 Transcript_121259/m.238290 type:complete len:239 (+) Transcript_121259:353-1069(+)